MDLIPRMFLSLVTTTLIFCSICLSSNCCKVEITEPWEHTTHVPQGSSAHFNCTVSKSEQSLIIWSILLVGTDTPSQFGFQESINLLNSRGFYQLPMVTTESDCTIQLLMNSTDNNNGTVVRCDGINPPALLQETNIAIFNPVSVSLSATDTQLQAINLSWSPPPQFPGTPEYTLRVTSDNTDTMVYKTLETFFAFNASSNTPPCEVYNFSVTAIPVGATYTGDGCSVPSQHVLSRMLPSLPDVHALEASLNYSLSSGPAGITLNVSYQSLDHCEMYPLINYTLEIRGEASQYLQTATSTTNQITVHGLSENELHRFNITAFNSVGSVKSSEVQFYTTDVQSIIVEELQASEDGFTVKIQCDFIATSNARGCMVVLTGEDHNTSLTIMKRRPEHTSVHKVFSVNRSLSCYYRIEAFDIESDGSIGTIAIPGNSEGTTLAQCHLTTTMTYSGSLTLSSLVSWLLLAIMLFLSVCLNL